MKLSIPTLLKSASDAFSGKRHRLKRSIVSIALASFLGATLFAAVGATSAFADTVIYEGIDEDGTLYDVYERKDGSLYTWVTYTNGEYEIIELGNPNPEDDRDGHEYTPESVKDFLAQFGGATDPPQDRWDNPLGVQLTQEGQGIIPAHNPADVLTKTFDDGTGMVGNSPFDPNGGDFTQQLKKNGTSGGSDTSADDDNDDPDRGEVGLFDEDMPGPPPLVNPAPIGTIGR